MDGSAPAREALQSAGVRPPPLPDPTPTQTCSQLDTFLLTHASVSILHIEWAETGAEVVSALLFRFRLLRVSVNSLRRGVRCLKSRALWGTLSKTSSYPPWRTLRRGGVRSTLLRMLVTRRSAGRSWRRAPIKTLRRSTCARGVL